jgi:AcrR family transcriptional regulator
LVSYAATVTDRPYHHGNLRTELLQAAERTVREHGAQALSLREVAREVGVSHAAPRRHFADRQALLDALAEAGFQRLGAELREAAGGAGADYEQGLQAVGKAYVVFATRDAALLELMFAGKHREASGPLHDAATHAFAIMLELIEQGQQLGLLEAGEPESVGLALFAAMQGMASFVNGGMVDAAALDQLVPDAIERFVRGSGVRVSAGPA